MPGFPCGTMSRSEVAVRNFAPRSFARIRSRGRIMTALSTLILARRAELGMQQKQLAAAAGIHITTIWDYEHGKSRPRLPQLFLLAKALQLPPAMLAAAISPPEGAA